MQMNDYQRYYVYTHTDPVTGQVRYVGMGSEGRAWQVKKTSQRSAEHYEWAKTHMDAGYTLAEMVNVVRQRLTKEAALELEASLIKEYPSTQLFNVQGTGVYLGKVTEEVEQFAKTLHQMGYGYQRVAFLLGADNPKKKVMSAKRMINIAR